MEWNGIDRRKDTRDHDCKFEDRVISMCEDITETKTDVKNLSNRINGSIDAFVNHIKSGQKWRTSIIIVALGLIVQVVTIAYMYGNLSKTVINNEWIIKKVILEKTINENIGEK